MSGSTPWRGHPGGLAGYLEATTPATTPAAGPAVKRDVCGMIYDSSTERDGVVYYVRNRAKGTAAGPARWSSLDDVNPVCGHHLASKCTGCNGCLTCDGCYCREGEA